MGQRYIDADKLEKRLTDFSNWCRDERKAGVDFVLNGVLPDSPILEDEPETNEQGILRGHWIGKPISGYADCKCSVCGAICNVHVSAGIPTQRYCYKCGALMLED